MQAGNALVLMAMEKDVATSETIGTAAPILWSDICAYEGAVRHKLDVIDPKG